VLDGFTESAEGGEMKTPEELADEHTKAWWGDSEDSIMTIATRQSFLAGYQAGFKEAKKYWATTPKYELLDEEEE